MKIKLKFAAGIFYLMATGLFPLQTLTKPNTFAAGEVISSSKINENFDKLFETAFKPNGADILYSGSITATRFLGDGSGLSGIAGATGGVSNTGTTNIASGTSGAGDTIFSTNTIERLRILASNGRVGIGTPTPTQTLDVTGNANITGNLSITGTLSAGAVTGSVPSSGGTMTGALNLPANGLVVGTTQLVASGGNVGIGTATPGSNRLMIKSGGTNTSVFRIENSANTNALLRMVQDSANQGVLQIYGADGVVDIQLGADGVSSSINSGNFGIGTTSPGSKLTIQQTANTTADGLSIVNGGVTWYAYGDPAGRLKLEASSYSNAFVLAGDGLIGMGTGTPSAQLEINKSGLADGAYIVKAVSSSVPGGFAHASFGAGTDKTTIRLGNSGSGDSYRFWVDDSGLLRINNGIPASDTSGIVLGDQTSTRDSKQDIRRYSQIDLALENILSARLYSFRYKNEVVGYKGMAKTRIGFIADEVAPEFMDAFGRTIDQVSVNAMLIASVQRLNQKIEAREAEITALKAALSKKDLQIARFEKMEARLGLVEAKLNTVARR